VRNGSLSKYKKRLWIMITASPKQMLYSEHKKNQKDLGMQKVNDKQ
jgi:hypothetical protein